MKSATRVLVSTFGGFVGIMGVEHGLGEILQGNIAPDSLMILSWPEADFFKILGGEPALTILPNLLVTGILACLVSLVYLLWATLFVQRQHAGRILALICIPLLLVGGGIFPPVLGLLVSAGAGRLHTSPAGWQSPRLVGRRRLLASLWPWAFVACLLSWLGMFPGLPVLSYFFGVGNDNLIFALLGSMFGFLFLAGISGLARDSQQPVILSTGA